MLKQVAAIALLSLVAVPQLPASAQLVISKDATGNVYAYPYLIPVATAKYSSGLKSSSTTANGCGVIKVSAKKLEGATGILIDEISRTIPTTITKYYPCVGATAGITAITKTDNGDIYYPGFVPNSKHQVKLPVDSVLTRNITPNACGIVKFSDTEAYPLDKLMSIDGEAAIAANLPISYPPICKNYGGSDYVLYLPNR